MINKFKKNKQGKIFILMAVIITTLALIFLILISSELKKASDKVLGSHQKAMINTLNKKDSILLYLDESAILAKKTTLQSTLAKNAGYFERTGVDSQDSDVTGFGQYVYPLLSNSSGALAEIDYEQEYLKLFRYNLLKYTTKNSYFNTKSFSAISLSNEVISALAEAPEIELLISSQDFDDLYFFDTSIVNTEIKNNNADKVVAEIKKIDITTGVFVELKAGDCSRFMSRLLDEAYSVPPQQNPIICIPNNAWDVAACYLDKAQNNPEQSRVVYAGNGIKYSELTLIDNLLKKGDLLFTTSSAWPIYTGYNHYYNAGANEFDNYCKPDSILDSGSEFPKKCIFNDDINEGGVFYEDYPIVTHIFMYLGKDENGEHIIANLFNEKIVGESLQGFVDNPVTGGDGVRIIIRPVYTKIT